MAHDSHAGGSLWNEIRDLYAAGKNLPLRKRALAEFDPNPSGLYLPGGKVIKRFDPQRIWRVVWKINRGLYAIEMGIFLPEDTPRSFYIVEPDMPPPEWFPIVSSRPGHGIYPSAFDYKYTELSFNDEPKTLPVWALLFWDRLITITTFHGLTCGCQDCRAQSVPQNAKS
jgi:hypothetical protein